MGLECLIVSDRPSKTRAAYCALEAFGQSGHAGLGPGPVVHLTVQSLLDPTNIVLHLWRARQLGPEEARIFSGTRTFNM